MPMSVIRRLETLEDQVQELSTLPARLTRVEDRLTSVEGRLGKVEVEMHSMREEFQEFRIEVRNEFVRVRADADETRRHMRVLHEDVIARITLLQEGVARINGGTSRKMPKKRR